jgi:alpha-mannosidase
MSQPRLHMIGNAHLDPVWLWRWPEGCAEAIGTCWAAVELLAEYPGVIFTRGEAVIYRWIEDLDPGLFARIVDLVRAGRWVIAGGWWLQPDCNLPGGESFIRQALYGKRYFSDRFGIDVTIGYNVDSFGHAATLPMLLRHTGFSHYVFMRPKEHELPLPASLFDWVAPDGSAVAAFRIPVSYHTAAGTAPPTLQKIEMVEEWASREGLPLMCFYGIGNHGGGPTRNDMAVIARMQSEGHNLVFSDPKRYFDEVAGMARPATTKELQIHAIGCYSAVSSLKLLNRRTEAALCQAEAACSLAQLKAGSPYPHEQLRRLWETLLFNQFHDILCGTSVPSATRDAEQALGGAIQDAEELTTYALRHLAATVAQAPSATDSTFLVFNLTGGAQNMPLEYEPWTSWKEDETYRLLDDSGAEIACQDVQPENYAHPGLHRVLFTPRVPAFGYRLFRYAEGAGLNTWPSNLRVTPHALENSRWRVEIDPTTGGISAMVDKQAGRALFSATAHLPLVVDDPSDTWGHGLDHFGLQGEAFQCEHVSVLESGPVRGALRVRSRRGASTVTSTYLLCDDPELPLEIRVTVDWRGQHQLLRLCYPFALESPEFRYEVPYGSVCRADDGRECTGQRWVLASGAGEYGAALANDAKYSYAAAHGTLYMTVLRSPVFAHHEPYVLDPAGNYPYVDQGEQSFTLRLLAGKGLTASAAHRLADELLSPPIATPHVARAGTGPYKATLLQVRAGSSTATCLKMAEDGSGAILRILEHDGKPDTVVLEPSGDRFMVQPYGMLTLQSDGQGHWHQRDGLERQSAMPPSQPC